MADERCVCNIGRPCMADEHDEPKDPLHRPTRYVRPTSDAAVDWPARFRAASDVATDSGMHGTARDLRAIAVDLHPQLADPDPHVVEAIGRALNGETAETETAAELAGRDGDTTHA